ncbi:MAG: hypothetical protein JWL61_5558 [Gemmatimonadetes bacterium]|nr:hypothetical protein [Gemmatimonadota bacterium]
MAHAVGLHHATTRPGVIEAFLSLAPGRPCTEFRRAESERVLRAQPFLSDAIVRVERDSGGMVAVVVTTTDEIPVLVSGRFRGIAPESFSIGNENLGGAALRLVGRVERGRSYQTAVGIGLEQDALFGHPYRFILDADRYQVGQRVNAEIEHPFFTDLQRLSWHVGGFSSDEYFRFERPARDPLALSMTNKSWEASALLRLFGTETVALLGAAVSARRFDPARAGIIVSDSGLVPDTGSALLNRYDMFKVGRVGILGGLRRVTFRTVNGFDALIGSQDVMNGAMLGIYAAKGLPQFGESDMLFSSALYLGASTQNALIASVALAEIRRDNEREEWNSGVGSARTAFYWGNAPGMVFVLDNELSVGWHSRLPIQLTFRDPTGGLAGYRASGLAGATRSVTRAELRWSAASMMRKADVGFAAFSEVGQLWKGDVPYGVNSTRTSVGVSLLAAYPSRSKRLYRADVAFPLSPSGATGSRRIEVRFSSADRTQGFWIEPGDVSRARTGVEPSRLFAWPTQ